VSCQERRFARALITSGLPPQTDILRVLRHVSKVPTAEVVLVANRHVRCSRKLILRRGVSNVSTPHIPYQICGRRHQ
jgi:hypothetical protein